MRFGLAATLIALTLPASVSDAFAQSGTLTEDDLRALEDQLTGRLQELEAQQQQLQQQLQSLAGQLDELREARAALTGEPVVPPDRADTLRGAGTGVGAPAAPVPVPAETPPPPAVEPPVEVAQQTAPEPERPELPIIVERGGVLLPEGRLVVEPSLEYNLAEVDTIEIAGFTVLPAILIGSFDVSSVERESIVGNLSFRYGVTDRLNVQARLPGVYREDEVTGFPLGVGASEEETSRLDAFGIGDLELAANYQINEGIGGGPYYVANLRGRFPTGRDPFELDTDEDGNPTELATGTGFYSVQPSLTAIFPTDPAVYYGSLSYQWNIARDIDDLGEIDPGDIIGVNFGIGLSLNEETSLNFAYDHQIVGATEQDGTDVAGSETLQVGRLLVGSSYRLTDWASINLSFGFGVTEDAPDLQATVRVPIAFDLY